MRWLATCLLLLTLPLRAAVGDITLSVEAGGDICDVWVSGFNTNGLFRAGLTGGFNQLSPTNGLRIDVTSMGFNSAGQGVQRARSVYGTKLLRLPYPKQTTNDISAVGSDAMFRVWLNRPVFSRDSNLLAYAVSGAFGVTNGSGTNSLASSGVSVTNLSTLPYPRLHANAAWPRWTWITNRADGKYTFRVAVDANIFSQDGCPAACVQAWAVDDSGNNTGTNTLTRPDIDPSMGDKTPVIEYVFNLPYANLKQGGFVTNHWAVYAHVGDTPLNSSDGFWAGPTPLWSGSEMRCDRSNLLFSAIALVSTNGNDATGLVTNGPLSLVTPPALPFATHAAAMLAIVNYNSNTFGHRDLAGGILYQKENATNWAWSGSGKAYGTNGGAWFTIALYPGVAPANSYFQFNSANWRPTNNLCLQGIQLRFTNNDAFDRITNLWFRDCIMDSTVQATPDFIDNCKLVYATGCVFSNWNQGLKPFSTQPVNWALIRNCDFSHFNSTVLFYTMLGNVRYDDAANPMATGAATGQSGFTLIQDSSGGTCAPPEGQLCLFNRFYGLRSSGSVFKAPTSFSSSNGWAYCQNVFEYSTNSSAGSAGFDFGTANTLNYSNVNYGDNVFAGLKAFIAYNDQGTAAAYRKNWSMFGNIAVDFNIKSDIFGTGSANRIGNWSVLNGVSCEGNYWLESTNLGAAGSFLMEFGGINSYQPALDPLTSSSQSQASAQNSTNAPHWMSLKAWYGTDGPDDAGGNGDYRMRSDGPIQLLVAPWTFPYDIMGRSRGIRNRPGAYVEGDSFTASCL